MQLFMFYDWCRSDDCNWLFPDVSDTNTGKEFASLFEQNSITSKVEIYWSFTMLTVHQLVFRAVWIRRPSFWRKKLSLVVRPISVLTERAIDIILGSGTPKTVMRFMRMDAFSELQYGVAFDSTASIRLQSMIRDTGTSCRASFSTNWMIWISSNYGFNSRCHMSSSRRKNDYCREFSKVIKRRSEVNKSARSCESTFCDILYGDILNWRSMRTSRIQLLKWKIIPCVSNWPNSQQTLH